MSLQSIDIFGFKSGAQKKNKKPFLYVDDAFQELENAYCYRDEIKKREGLRLIGRLQRNLGPLLILVALDGSGNGEQFLINTFAPGDLATASIVPGSINVSDGTNTFTDALSNGIISGNPAGSGTINYATGQLNLTGGVPGAPVNGSFSYYPGLPVMGIETREIAAINNEQTIWFDTKYAYINSGGFFQELSPGTTWDGTDSNFFWSTNYRGITPDVRLFFVTNFVNDAGSPMRYLNASTWTPFLPAVSSTQFLFNALILIPYYSRLLAFNVWEGTTIETSVNIFNRCRFSQIGDPTDQVNGWRSDIYGRGGFIDAPTNEAITSAIFFKNTLIVTFERSTWRLQYLGEYGLPFIWERISSDFGSGSTFSTILFDIGVLAVGDKAIMVSNGGNVERIDLDIPDQVYQFKNTNNGSQRIQGIRDFKKEIAYWCYPDTPNFQLPGQYYPNKTLVYNYRNNTFAFFRNNITTFGNFQYQYDVTWDRTDVFWDDYQVLWDGPPQVNMPLIVSGNQHGYCHFFSYEEVQSSAVSNIDANDQESLFVQAIVASTTVQLIIPNHNLSNFEFIYLTSCVFVNGTVAGSTTLNNKIYQIQVIDLNTILLFLWNTENNEFDENFEYTNIGTYFGGGSIALFPKLYIETKDFSPLKQQIGQNIKTSYIDFLFDASTPSPINVLMKMNTTLEAQGNLDIGNYNVETANSMTGYITNIIQDAITFVITITSQNHGLLNGYQITPLDVGGMTQINGNIYTVTFIDINTFSISAPSFFTAYTFGGYWVGVKQGYYTLSAEYAWHRFFSSCYGQFLSIVLTYDDVQMTNLSTHRQNFILNAMKIFYRPGGNNIFGK
jgi:hypothetical protein